MSKKDLRGTNTGFEVDLGVNKCSSKYTKGFVVHHAVNVTLFCRWRDSSKRVVLECGRLENHKFRHFVILAVDKSR